MVDRSRFNWPRVLGTFSGALLLLAGTVALAAQPAASQTTGGPGPEVCKNCHVAQFESYQASKHGQKGNLGGPANAGGCSSCHGDGAAHVKAGGGKGVGGIINPGPRSKALSADAKSKICLSCHESERQLTFWDSGKHKKNDVTCTNCHNPHSESPSHLRQDNPSISPYVTTSRQLQHETCVTCHKDIRAQIMKPTHHPIIEGKIKCSDCHNPHGALSDKMINSESINGLCTTCHAEKRGPYIREHPPVEENCLNCHTPHGSSHFKLLTQRPPMLCQNCHDWTRHPGTPYGAQRGFGPTPAVQFVERGCVNCHNQIHGSNAPSGRGEFFVR